MLKGATPAELVDISGIDRQRVYRLLRLPDAPKPLLFKGKMRIYDLDQALAYLTGGSYNASSED